MFKQALILALAATMSVACSTADASERGYHGPPPRAYYGPPPRAYYGAPPAYRPIPGYYAGYAPRPYYGPRYCPPPRLKHGHGAYATYPALGYRGAGPRPAPYSGKYRHGGDKHSSYRHGGDGDWDRH